MGLRPVALGRWNLDMRPALCATGKIKVYNLRTTVYISIVHIDIALGYIALQLLRALCPACFYAPTQPDPA